MGYLLPTESSTCRDEIPAPDRHLIRVCLDQPDSHPKQHLDRLIRFGTVHGHVQQTHRHTLRAQQWAAMCSDAFEQEERRGISVQPSPLRDAPIQPTQPPTLRGTAE